MPNIERRLRRLEDQREEIERRQHLPLTDTERAHRIAALLQRQPAGPNAKSILEILALAKQRRDRECQRPSSGD